VLCSSDKRNLKNTKLSFFFKIFIFFIGLGLRLKTTSVEISQRKEGEVQLDRGGFTQASPMCACCSHKLQRLSRPPEAMLDGVRGHTRTAQRAASVMT